MASEIVVLSEYVKANCFCSVWWKYWDILYAREIYGSEGWASWVRQQTTTLPNYHSRGVFEFLRVKPTLADSRFDISPWWVARLMRRMQAIRCDALGWLICGLPKHRHDDLTEGTSSINHQHIKRQLVHFKVAPVEGASCAGRRGSIDDAAVDHVDSHSVTVI